MNRATCAGSSPRRSVSPLRHNSLAGGLDQHKIRMQCLNHGSLQDTDSSDMSEHDIMFGDFTEENPGILNVIWFTGEARTGVL
jgi:hypothetical protein